MADERDGLIGCERIPRMGRWVLTCSTHYRWLEEEASSPRYFGLNIGTSCVQSMHAPRKRLRRRKTLLRLVPDARHGQRSILTGTVSMTRLDASLLLELQTWSNFDQRRLLRLPTCADHGCIKLSSAQPTGSCQHVNPNDPPARGPLSLLIQCLYSLQQDSDKASVPHHASAFLSSHASSAPPIDEYHVAPIVTCFVNDKPLV